MAAAATCDAGGGSGGSRRGALTHFDAQGEGGHIQQQQVGHLLVLLPVQDGSLRRVPREREEEEEETRRGSR